MTRRQTLDLPDRDIAMLARITDTSADELVAELARRPWALADLLRHPAVVDAVLDDVSLCPEVSPLLFFAVLTHQAAEDLTDTSWVADWAGPKSRLPVFDVDPVAEFAEAPTRLLFIAGVLAAFAAPETLPVPDTGDRLSELAGWLGAAAPADRVILLRRLGDLALFQAGVFPDAIGGRLLAPAEAAQLGQTVGLAPEEIEALTDPGSPAPGLDARETLGSAWYHACANESTETPAVLLDVASRIRPARRFLNHLADRYLHDLSPALAFG